MDRTLRGWAADELLDEALLLASELVTNAVVHAGTDVGVACVLLLDGVQIEVTDYHPVRPLPPAPLEVDEVSEGGRGLQLISLLSQAWGVDYTAASKRTWFRLPFSTGRGEAPTAAALPSAVVDGRAAPGAGIATFELTPDGRVRRWDTGAVALLGWPAEDVEGRPWSEIVAPDDVAVLLAAAGAARWQGSYAVRRPDGSSLPVLARHVFLGGQDDAATMCLLVDQRWRRLLTDQPDTRTPSGVLPAEGEGTFLRGTDLLRLDLDDLLSRTIEWAQGTLAGQGGYALLATDGELALEVRATSGLRGTLPRFSRLPVDEGVSGRVSRSLMPLVRDDIAQDVSVEADDWLRAAGVRSLVAAPLLAEGRLIGSVGVTSTEVGRFGIDDAVLLQRTVDSVALAVQNARVTELERARRGWLSYAAEASDLLAGTLELEMTLAMVVQLVVPRLGPWCVVYLLDESGAPRPASSWHSDEDRLDDLRGLIDKVPPPEISATARVRRWHPDLSGAPGGILEVSDLVAGGGHVVPLVARGRAIGALAMGGEPAALARPDQLHLLADLAPRAALAIDNAGLYAERTATSRALQRSLLPPELPLLAGVEIGVAYEAAGAGNDVGGDFYDVFPLPGHSKPDDEADQEGRFAFAVGDVCGKGPEAAAVTGLARHALRLLGRRGDDIASVLAHLNAAILDEGSRTRFMTVVYGEGHRREDGALQLSFASAGHPAPVVLRRDGSVSPAGRAGDLLGVFESLETSVTEVLLEPGDMLVCFTDGVTERRDGGRMLGEAGVRAALADCGGLPAAAVARRLQDAVASFAASPPRDDLAILALRPT